MFVCVRVCLCACVCMRVRVCIRKGAAAHGWEEGGQMTVSMCSVSSYMLFLFC